MNKSRNDKIITFYDVPLVCGAAPAIGCGSRAKPFLIDLERQAVIEEAWMNRAGTIVAIVWSGLAHASEIAKPIFEKHEIRYQERLDDMSASFRQEGIWFRSVEVDRLSLEEAREIAEIAVAAAVRERLVSDDEAAQIKSDIETHFRQELVKLRSKQELLQDTQGEFPQAVLDIYQRHIGMERTTEVQARAMQNPFDRADREKTLSCC